MEADYGKHTRVGKKFSEEIKEIQNEMYKGHGFVSFEKITNLMCKHKIYWPKIKFDIINANKEEVKNANEVRE